MEALPGTLLLAVAAMCIAVALGIPLGVLAAVKKDTWMDTSAIFTSVLGISAPSFFMGIVIAYLFGFVWSQYTGLHMTGSWRDMDEITGQPYWSLQHLWLPAITLGIRPLRHYYPANPQCHARCAEPGLYKNGLCQRIIKTGGYLEACLT